MSSTRRKHQPVQQSVHADCAIEDAFRLFTEGFSEWWPLALYSISGADAKYCFLEPWVGGRVFERTASGEEHEWGSVTAWNPPEHLRVSWHPGAREAGGQTVDVEFRTDAQGTRVTVTHRDWDASGVAVCSLQGNGASMWLTALEHYFCQFVAEQALVVA